MNAAVIFLSDQISVTGSKVRMLKRSEKYTIAGAEKQLTLPFWYEIVASLGCSRIIFFMTLVSKRSETPSVM